MKQILKRTVLLAPLVAVVLLLACSSSDDNNPVKPDLATGTVVAQVYYDAQGVPDKRIDLLEPKLTGTTDKNGYVTFTVPAGTYTLRAYAINQGGPSLQHVDMEVIVKPGKQATVRIFDCLSCV